ncbi:hypothetical protein TRFO_26638 [Tritrichomonas foetus]|uniref:Uncharacterized protein n=1 Tax=Tritrichomonas foetus TaxID=1144522 RepID=A0A1J4K3M2_9EUKA|nr:hypothetical protein TRFO_26638 [Tritrichomonas foetus]|eukprot:OHT05570.1 hypothetical protein TRFO_26638 [Tritrichomonas foetus]
MTTNIFRIQPRNICPNDYLNYVEHNCFLKVEKFKKSMKELNEIMSIVEEKQKKRHNTIQFIEDNKPPSSIEKVFQDNLKKYQEIKNQIAQVAFIYGSSIKKKEILERRFERTQTTFRQKMKDDLKTLKNLTKESNHKGNLQKSLCYNFTYTSRWKTLYDSINKNYIDFNHRNVANKFNEKWKNQIDQISKVHSEKLNEISQDHWDINKLLAFNQSTITNINENINEKFLMSVMGFVLYGNINENIKDTNK